MMKSKVLLAILAASVAVPTIDAAPAFAKNHDYYYDRNGHRVYRNNDRDYRYRCKRSNGTTGLIAGGAGGALIGNAVGGGVLGTVAGGVGGALLGRHLDKRHDRAQNRRNGC